MGRVRTGVVMLIVAAILAAAGCTPAEEPEPAQEPMVAPPAISKEGVLRAGIDLGYPPYAGTDKGREAGIDVDVAAALAAELGLELELVDLTQASAAEALEDDAVDVVMSVPLTEESLLEVSFAGWYVATGPALFSAAEETATARAAGGMRTAAQEGSVAYWDLVYELGEGEVFGTETLREAFEALDSGEVETVAGDALTGAYLLRDFPDLGFAGQLGPATPVGVAVSTGAPELEWAVRSALDTLAASGILDTIRLKWVGDLPQLEVEGP